MQVSRGTMADKLMYIPNYDTPNHSFSRLHLVVETLDTQLIEPTNQNSITQIFILDFKKNNFWRGRGFFLVATLQFLNLVKI